MDLLDSKARLAITLLSEKYVAPYLAVYKIVTAERYLEFHMGIYDIFTEVGRDPTLARTSNLFAYNLVTESILEVGHVSKVSTSLNDPNYNPGVHADKYLEEFLTPSVIVDFLLPKASTAEKNLLIAKLNSGEMTDKSFVSAVGLALTEKSDVSATDVLRQLPNTYGNKYTLEHTSTTDLPTIIGHEGIDTAKLTSDPTKYIANHVGDIYTFTNIETKQRSSFQDIERFHFDNGTVIAVDTDGAAGQAYRLYKAAFDRVPDKGGLGYWIEELDNGATLLEVAAKFITTPEFIKINGATPSSLEFATSMYQHVLGRAPDQGGLTWWVDQLDTGAKTRSEVLVGFSESSENQIALTGQMQAGIEYLAA